jgi:hypothetical protein
MHTIDPHEIFWVESDPMHFAGGVVIFLSHAIRKRFLIVGTDHLDIQLVRELCKGNVIRMLPCTEERCRVVDSVDKEVVIRIELVQIGPAH